MKDHKAKKRRKPRFPARGRGNVPSAPSERSRARWLQFLTHDVWHIEVADLSRFRALATRVSRVVLIAGRDFLRDRCMQQAAALTYLTIFTLPALLALVFSVAKGLNAFEILKARFIDPFLDHAFPADGGEASTTIRDVVAQVFTYVQEADLGVLGTFGVLFLVYAALKMLGSVERSFNEIWGVQRSRSLVRKFSDYLAIVAVVPIVLLVATGFTGFLTSSKLQSWLGGLNAAPLIAASIPLIAICAAMTLVLITLPNTRVRFGPALAGGIVAGVVWQLAQVAFVKFQIGLTNANAIFSSFAAVPLLLSWIYLSWVTVFVGAELSFAIQNERAMTSLVRTGEVDQRYREALAPRLAGRIAAAFLRGERAPSVMDLATSLGVAPRLVAGILEALCDQRLLVETSEDADEGFLPGRDPDTITVFDLVDALRRGEEMHALPTNNRLDERVDRILATFDEKLSGATENHTLRELALTLLEAPDREQPAAGSEGTPAPAEDPVA